MRRVLLAAALAAVALTTASADQMLLLGVGRPNASAASPLLTNLIAYWELNEASGNAIDSHNLNCGGGGCDLTETSGTIASTTGIVGNARDFEAADTEQFELADNADLSTGNINFTMVAWVFAETLASFPPIMHKGWVGAPDGDSEWALFYNTTSSRMEFSKRVAATVTITANNAGALSTGAWYFVAAWHDADADSIGIRVFGAASDTANTGPSSTGVNDGTRAFQLGATSATGLEWDGLIDEAGFWKRVLTSAELTWLYNAGAGRSYADVVACSGC